MGKRHVLAIAQGKQVAMTLITFALWETIEEEKKTGEKSAELYWSWRQKPACDV